MAFRFFLYHTQIRSCFHDWSQGTQYMFMGRHYLQIWPWKHLASRWMHYVCLYVCVPSCLPLQVVYFLRQICYFLQNFCLLKCVCYLCIKHVTMTQGQNRSSRSSVLWKLRCESVRETDSPFFPDSVLQSVCYMWITRQRDCTELWFLPKNILSLKIQMCKIFGRNKGEKSALLLLPRNCFPTIYITVCC